MSSRRSSSFHTFTGQPQNPTAKKQSFSQATLRRPLTLWDQHGRQWWASVEIRSGLPTGNIEPKDFRAPWIPDQQYLICNPDDASELFIDYRRMATDRKVAEDEYHAAALQLAGDKKWPMPAYGEYPREIVEALGRQPRSRLLVLAGWQCNPWLLGESEVPDPRLVALVERERPKPTARPEDWNSGDFGPESYDAVAGTREPSKPSGEWIESDEPSEEDIAALESTDALDSFDAEHEIESLDEENNENENESDDALLERALAEEEEHDPHAIGGKVLSPRAANRHRSAPSNRRGKAPASTRRQAAPANAPPKKKRPTLADGAAPVIAR